MVENDTIPAVEQYLESLKYTLHPDKVSQAVIDTQIKLDIHRLLLCPGGRGRSKETAILLTRLGYPSICLGLGADYLLQMGEVMRKSATRMLATFPTKIVIMDKYNELPRFAHVLVGLGNYDQYNDYWDVINAYK